MKAQVANIPEESFQSYLWNEVDSKGHCYEEALQKLFTVADVNVGPGDDVIRAAQVLVENMRLYTGALRRVAHFTSHS